jgi:hypothetical protein
MSSLYSMTAARKAILQFFRISENRLAAIARKSAFFPGHYVPGRHLRACLPFQVAGKRWIWESYHVLARSTTTGTGRQTVLHVGECCLA